MSPNFEDSIGRQPNLKRSAFVHKLYAMLSDQTLSGLIWWTRTDLDGTFAVLPCADFCTALTKYFKHGNIASFVRQLHMYGFHKVSDDNTSMYPTQSRLMWEFKHSSGIFKKGDEDSLAFIKRRSSSNSSKFSNTTTTSPLLQNGPPTPTPQVFPVPMLMPQVYPPLSFNQLLDSSRMAAEEIAAEQRAMCMQRDNVAKGVMDLRETMVSTASVLPSVKNLIDTPTDDESGVLHGLIDKCRDRSLRDYDFSKRDTITSFASYGSRSSSQNSGRQRYPSLLIDPLAPIPAVDVAGAQTVPFQPWDQRFQNGSISSLKSNSIFSNKGSLSKNSVSSLLSEPPTTSKTRVHELIGSEDPDPDLKKRKRLSG